VSARAAQVGDTVTTDYTGRVTRHKIVARCDDRSHGHSQSGIMFQVDPPVPKSGGARAWLDADWFHPTDQANLF
jgi:hypothetical protein